MQHLGIDRETLVRRCVEKQGAGHFTCAVRIWGTS
jgi:hypothetical protein